jgi:lipid-binding SYLF domain-containing protein
MQESTMRALLALALAAVPALAGPPAETVTDATEVLVELAKIPIESIPPKLLDDSQAVIVVPKMLRFGVFVAGRRGHGVVLTKNDNGEWGEPSFVIVTGASVGFQAGVQSIDAVMVVRKRATLDRLMQGKGKLTLGADAAISAGPVGRNAEGATDGKLQAEILSYSRSRGLFAGVSLAGAVMAPDDKANAKARGDEATATATAELRKQLTAMAKTK